MLYAKPPLRHPDPVLLHASCPVALNRVVKHFFYLFFFFRFLIFQGGVEATNPRSSKKPVGGSKRGSEIPGSASKKKGLIRKSSDGDDAETPKRTKQEEEKPVIRHPIPEDLRGVATEAAGRAHFTYRCPYCVKKTAPEPQLLYAHIERVHQDFISEEAGSTTEDKWSAVFWRCENLTRKALRTCDPGRLLQHVASINEELARMNRQDLIKDLNRSVHLVAAELSTRLRDETHPPPSSVASHKELLEMLRHSRAYKGDARAEFRPLPR